MKLIVGLGNPGRKYKGTRHNVGFEVLAEVARRRAKDRPKDRFEADVVETEISGEKTLLVAPRTYMNLSGLSVVKAAEFYKIALADVLVVCDDFNLPLAKLRFRSRGTAGGQKGLADIIRRLGSEEFCRLRVGVGPVPDRWDAADFVLSKFRPSELPVIEEAVQRAADGVLDWINDGIEVCMNRYN